jgi:hypothetical protein
MNSPQNGGENDMDLNQGLDKLGQRYGQLQQDEPPELLDLAILNSAHRAVEKKPHWMKFGWLHGLTTAAVFVLAFSLILNQPESPAVFENDLGNNEPVSLQREMVAKKQSLDVKSADRLAEMKEKNEVPEEMPQSMPAAAVAESPVAEITPDDKAGESKPVVQRATYADDSLSATGYRSDKDISTSGLQEEETDSDEDDLMADSPEIGAMYELSLPAQQPESAKVDAAEKGKSDSEIKQRLLEIMKLRQKGDETWRTALESFKESYPDYPLPHELAQ